MSLLCRSMIPENAATQFGQQSIRGQHTTYQLYCQYYVLHNFYGLVKCHYSQA